MPTFKQKLKHVKGFIFDVDGVFTDGKIYILPDGKQMRNMSVKDGYAVHFAIKKGYPIGIISGGRCESIRVRFEELGVRDIYLASKDKNNDFADFLKKNNLSTEDIMYVGDDLPDLPVMMKAGLAACPSDAAQEIQNIAHYISHKRSGDGCVREIIEQVLKTQGKWADSDAFVW